MLTDTNGLVWTVGFLSISRVAWAFVMCVTLCQYVTLYNCNFVLEAVNQTLEIEAQLESMFSCIVILRRSHSRESGGWVGTGGIEKGVILKYNMLSCVLNCMYSGLGSARIFMENWKRLKESGNPLHWRLYPCYIVMHLVSCMLSFICLLTHPPAYPLTHLLNVKLFTWMSED